MQLLQSHFIHPMKLLIDLTSCQFAFWFAIHVVIQLFKNVLVLICWPRAVKLMNASFKGGFIYDSVVFVLFEMFSHKSALVETTFDYLFNFYLTQASFEV